MSLLVMTSEAIVCLMIMMWLKIHKHLTSNEAYIKCMNVKELDFEKLTKLLHFIGLFHYADPANSYTYALPVLSAVTMVK